MTKCGKVKVLRIHLQSTTSFFLSPCCFFSLQQYQSVISGVKPYIIFNEKWSKLCVLSRQWQVSAPAGAVRRLLVRPGARHLSSGHPGHSAVPQEHLKPNPRPFLFFLPLPSVVQLALTFTSLRLPPSFRLELLFDLRGSRAWPDARRGNSFTLTPLVGHPTRHLKHFIKPDNLKTKSRSRSLSNLLLLLPGRVCYNFASGKRGSDETWRLDDFQYWQSTTKVTTDIPGRSLPFWEDSFSKLRNSTPLWLSEQKYPGGFCHCQYPGTLCSHWLLSV